MTPPYRNEPDTGNGIETLYGPTDHALHNRNEPDTGNGIETRELRVKESISSLANRNEPDTGNGIETTSCMASSADSNHHRNEPDTGNGIETATPSDPMCWGRTSRIGMSQIPETGLRLAISCSPFVVCLYRSE